MNMTPQEYQQYVKQKAPKSPLLKDTVLAFVVGGAICVVGQLILNGWTAAGLEEKTAGTATSCTLVFLSALLTGLNLYNKLARFGGAGTRWSHRPSTSAARDSSLAWRPRCS